LKQRFSFLFSFIFYRNLITSNDIHPPNRVDQETPLTNIHTIDEADEEEHTSQLLVNIFLRIQNYSIFISFFHRITKRSLHF
jgi:hypothetical protein